MLSQLTAEGKLQPLSLAVKKKDVTLAALLLSSGKYWPDAWMLNRAVDDKDAAMVKVLLETGKIKPHPRHLYDATGLGDIATVKLLLDINRRVDPNWRCERQDGQTALLKAISRGDEAVVEVLLASERVDVNIETTPAKKSNRTSPLALAAEKGYVGLVERLLSAKNIDPNQSVSGRTALEIAVGAGQVAVVKRMLDFESVDPECYDHLGRTPLMVAADRKDGMDIVELLLASGKVNVNSQTNFGRTALSYAICHVDIVKRLLGSDKVDPNLGDEDGITPLACAAKHGLVGTVRVLLSCPNVNANVKDSRGWAPLRHALSMDRIRQIGDQREEVVKLFLESGKIDPAIRDECYREAKDRKLDGLVKLLQQYGAT